MYLYRAFLQYTQGAQAWITQFYPGAVPRGEGGPSEISAPAVPPPTKKEVQDGRHLPKFSAKVVKLRIWEATFSCFVIYITY